MAGQGDRFGMSKYQLMELMSQRRLDAVAKVSEYGGARGIAEHLETNIKTGVRPTAGEIEDRVNSYGRNVIPPQDPKSFLSLCLDALQDKTLIILIIAAIISIVLGVTVEERKDIAWTEGAAILAAVVLVVLVTAINDWTKERQFRGLQKKLETDARFSVLRDGDIHQLPVADLIVGDIAKFAYGNTFPVDGILIHGNDVRINEASLTGETDLVHKKVDTDPMLLAGTQVMEGSGTMLVTAVGPYSQQGIIFTLMTSQDNRAGFITAAFRRWRKACCPRCEKEEEEVPPLPQINQGEVGGDKVEEGTYDPGSPVNSTGTDDGEEEEEELKGMAKLNLIKRMKRKKKDKAETERSKSKVETGSVLQRKLDKLAVRIGYMGIAAAVLCVLILALKFAIEEFGLRRRSWNSATDYASLLHFVIIGITVLVVAVPEGLPLAVTISLAFSVKKMLKDNNLVRHLHACETMGNATAICSDKTGTLTTNRMTVTQSFLASNMYEGTPQLQELSRPLVDILQIGIAVNSSYTSKLVQSSGRNVEKELTWREKLITCLKCGQKSTEDLLGEGLAKQVGNVTECALIGFLVELGLSYEDIREQHPVESFTKIYTFNSSRKSMSTVLPLDEGGYRVHTKGASEIVLKKCGHIMKENGKVVPLTKDDQKDIIRTVVTSMAEGALRTIALAYRDFPAGPEPNWVDEDNIIQDMTLIGIVGIQDPVRPEVPGCIRSCQESGITVRMVTGDNVETARAIAIKCGIISKGDNFDVMEGKEFSRKIRNPDGKISQEKVDTIWSNLRVLARSSPQDKYDLVEGIILSRITKSREVVAVTGDGTNDGPALKRADVGFAMGIAGTDVAKEASDIILTDDNFASIVKAVSWGRNVYDSISKFLQFQLTVNIVAVLLTLISAITIGDSPLRALQLLWVNLIMDTLASLALATEAPTPDLLKRKPYGRKRSLISAQMWLYMIGHSVYQLTLLLVLLFAGADLLNIDDGRGRELRATPGAHFTIIFNTFVFMQIFNELNARKVHGERNVFSSIHKNWIFLVVIVGQVSVQAILVEFGTFIFNTTHLSADLWLWCIFLGSTELLVGQLLLLIPIQTIVKAIPWKGRTTSGHEEDEVDGEDPLQDSATPARILWMKSLTRLRTQIRVVNAFRYNVESGSKVALAQLQSTPRPARYTNPVTGIETAV